MYVTKLGFPATTMKCSGYKCKCTEFQGTHKAKICKGCNHSRDSHYSPGSDSSGSNRNDGDDTDDDENDDDTDGNTARPSTGIKNKMTVSSLVADLVQGGEYSKADTDAAKREAKAGLMRRQVGSSFSDCHHKSKLIAPLSMVQNGTRGEC